MNDNDAILFDKLVSQFGRSQLEEMADQGPQGQPDSGDEADDDDNDDDDNDSDSPGSSDSDDELDDGIDENEQQHGDVQHGYLRVHDAVVHPNSFHCPPFLNIDDLPRVAHTNYDDCPCDCLEFGVADCFRDNSYDFFVDAAYPINFATELDLAIGDMNDKAILPNNIRRKHMYKRVFMTLDFGVLEPGERRRLPNCAVAKVRQLFPSSSGLYMGFKES